MTPEIVAYINKQRQAGANDEVTKKELLDAGWPPAAVNECFLFVGSAPSGDIPKPSTGANPAMQNDLAAFMGSAGAAGTPAAMGVPAGTPAATGTMPGSGIGRRIGQIIFIGLGLLMIYGGVHSYFLAKSLNERGINVSGKASGVESRVVIKEDSHGNSRQETQYRATILYKTNDGVDRRHQISWTSTHYSEGQTVPLSYLPEKPDQPVIGGASGAYASAGVFGVVGVLFSLIGAFGKFIPSRRRFSSRTGLRIGGFRV